MFKAPEKEPTPNFSSEKKEKGFELKEEDKKFLKEGLEREIQEAREKNRYGRATFIAARMAEIGMEPEIEEEDWKGMKASLQYKKEHHDGWGISFQSRYLKTINPEKFEKEIKIGEEAEEAMRKEINSRLEQKRWGDVLAMTDHLKEVAPEIYEESIKKIDPEGVKKELRMHYLGGDYRIFVHLALAAENIMPGSLQKIGFSNEEIKLAIQKVKENLNEIKEKGDVWDYSFQASQAKLLQSKFEKK
ncbi:hypothetical protein J7J81_00060 [bacterium]|nr:hypothetical protein [bacterium]